MTLGAALFVAFLIVQRVVELVIARHNTARLLADGAHEVGAAHYPLIVALHAAWIAAIAIFGLGETVHPFWLVLFAVLQLGRLWVLTTLGPRWTTRIIVTDAPLVVRGPFRFVRHPNYVVVAAEMLIGPLVLGLVWVGVLFFVLNALVLRIRIGAENAALNTRAPA